MRIRTVYTKVTDMDNTVGFWSSLLQAAPAKHTPHWSEFQLDGIRLGFLLNDFDETLVGNRCVPVFEFGADDLAGFVARACALGATVVIDGLDNPAMNSIVLADPTGQEFELCRCSH
ncbi:MAG: VOC family protein [Burkholderiales bacterium]|nr:VOC family protein [Burkholderiales bacterium]